MMAPFRSFVLFAEMRTGSNFLEANLNAMPGVTCHGEVFNPHFIGRLNQHVYLGIDLAARDRDPAALLARLSERTEGLAGFRYFHDHDPRILPLVLDDPTCAKIALTRNPVDSYVSWKIAQATGQWKLTQPGKLREAKAHFDATEFGAHLEALQGFQTTLLHALQTSGQTAFHLGYEDIFDLGVLNGLARFLGVGGIDALDEALKKQNPGGLEDKVDNMAEMEAALARLDRFNLGRTPNFEPRRAPGIPSFAASGPLLYMPIKGGPEARVTQWLGALGPVEGDFVQKSLRQWRRRPGPHRSFTVLRHPIARANAAFESLILSGARPKIAAAFRRAQKVALPVPGQRLTLADHRALFLAFLRFCKLSVAGQTGLHVDAHIASQTAILQGFAQHQGPDVVLREDRLAQGLAYLAGETGLIAPPLPASEIDAKDMLTQIYDPAVEAAAREAYGRDYTGFGFADWTQS